MASTSTTTTSTNNNRVTYAVGDFVYFDDPIATDAPYHIRKIDELVKTDKGSVDARCVVYLRRRDIPQHLLKIADQAQRRFDNYYEVDKKKPENFTTKGFVVANGGNETKEEEMEVDAEQDDGPPKIDAEEGAPAPVDQGRSSSAESAKEGDSKDANLKEKAEAESTKIIDWGDGGLPLGVDKLSPDQRLKLRQHEIFMTRQSEILPASLIRGKCRVVLLGDCEDADNYLSQEDTFYHSLVYDPTAQTLLADKGAIRVGDKYQAAVDDWMEPEEREEKERQDKEAKIQSEKVKKEEEEERIRQEAEEDTENGNGNLTIVEDEEVPEVKKEEVEEPKVDEEVDDEKKESLDRGVLVWHPHHGLLERDIDQYLIVARSVGLFARAIDGASAPKLPTLQLAAAFASRDVTIFHAHAILHQANYDVGQAVKYLVPIASREAYPCQVDETSGLQTKSLGGPILCRDQLEEWSTPEMNLFEDALDKCGKDFNEIRADYLPWKSIRDIVEYYYLMKASNRYTDRKKNKPSTNNTDEKFTNVYIPPFNKAISASILPFNTTQNLVHNESPCENCGTLDAINWYNWGGVEKKVLCSLCWVKWKKFAGLNEKHELERFDKTRPPVLDQPAAPGSNGSDRPPVLQVQQQKPATPSNVGNNLTPAQQRAAQQLNTFKNGDSVSKQSLLMVAQTAMAKGQISKEQYLQLKQNFAMQGFTNPSPSAGVQKASVTPVTKKAVPASKPSIVFYTTICRRAVRRLLPKTAFNLRKLSRKPFTPIDDEKILRAMIVLDKQALLQSACAAAGEKKSQIVESDFHKGITHLQHTFTQAATGKRSAPQTAHSGEPSAKMAKLHFQPPGVSIVAPSLEDVGNTLLAVKDAMKTGRPFLSTSAPSQNLLRRQHLQQYSFHPSMASSSTVQNSSSLQTQSRQIQNTGKSRRQWVKELMKTKTDSRWFIKRIDIKFRAGPRMKTKRRQLLTRHQIRQVARHPCTLHPFLESLCPILYPYFLEPISVPRPSPTH